MSKRNVHFSVYVDGKISDEFKTLNRMGSVARAYMALDRGDPKREGLTLADIADISGLSMSTLLSQGVRQLMHAQLVQRIPQANKNHLYILKPKATESRDFSVEIDGSKEMKIS